MPTHSRLSFTAPAYNPDPTFKTAIERASAPGLSLTQRLQHLVESVDIPNLTGQQQGNAPGLACAREKIQALEHFKSTPQYLSFKNLVMQTLTGLDSITNAARLAEQHNTNYQDFGQGLWQPVSEDQPSRFGAFQADLYLQACPDANRLLRMHTFAQQRPDLVASGGQDNARATITELSQRLDVCGPGVVQHFDEAVLSVRQAVFTPSLPERFEAMRIQIARNAISEFIREHPHTMGNRPGNEVHKIAAWQNHFSGPLHLPVVDDVFASSIYVDNRNNQTRLAIKLADLQTPSAVATVLASQILQETHNLLAQDRNYMTLLEKINSKHGPIEPHTLIDTDENGMPCGLHDNPTLLALSLIRQAEHAPEVHTQPETVKQWIPRTQQEHRTLSVNCRGHLQWLETNPGIPGAASEQLLLSTRHLSREQNQEFFDSVTSHQTSSVQLKAALHEMLRNDWASSWPQCKSQDFDPYVPNDVFLNLAMGFAHGLKLGQMDINLKYMNVLLKALDTLQCSNVLKNYTPEQIVRLLNYADNFNSSSYGRQVPLDVCRRMNSITELRSPKADIQLYKAALQFNWGSQPKRSAKLLIDNPAFTTRNSQYGLAYIDVMATCSPWLLTHTLCNNIKRIRCPEVVVRFLDSGATFTGTQYGQYSALQLLLQRMDDEFVAVVLGSLSQRGLSLHELADPVYTYSLCQRDMPLSAAILVSKCGLSS